MPDKEIDPKQEALGAIEGLNFSDCIEFFDAKATERDKQIAEMVDVEDEGFECENHIISEGDDNGAYVMGWRWASFSGTELSKICAVCDEGTTIKVITERSGEKVPMCQMCLDEVTCSGCEAVEGTEEWGTVGDGFDGYCPSCADAREESGEVETG